MERPAPTRSNRAQTAAILIEAGTWIQVLTFLGFAFFGRELGLPTWRGYDVTNLLVIMLLLSLGSAFAARRAAKNGDLDDAALWAILAALVPPTLNFLLIGGLLARSSPEARALSAARSAGPYSTTFGRWNDALNQEEEVEEEYEAAEEMAPTAPRRRTVLSGLRRVPVAAWTFLGLLAGLFVGYLSLPAEDTVFAFSLPVDLAPIGEGVKGVFGFIAFAAPLIIFFTITPALVTMFRTSSAGRFSAYVVLGFIVSTALGGLFALAVSFLFFPNLQLGIGGDLWGAVRGAGANSLDALTKAPFRALSASLVAGVVLYFGGALGRDAPPRNAFRRLLRTIYHVYELIGVHAIAALGRAIKYVMPFALFAIGIFLVASVPADLELARQNTAGLAEAPYGAVEAYFLSVGILVLISVLWLAAVSLALAAFCRFPYGRLLREYLLVVYPFAWSTSSSAASIPLNLEAARKGLGVRRQIRDFVLPFGATVNLDGTMMAAVVSTIIAAKMVGYDPTMLDMLLALIPLVLISVGTPGVPGGLAAVGAPVLSALLPLPPGTEKIFEGVFIALAVGLNDQFRTAVNTLDNGMFALLLDKWWPERFETGAEPNPFMGTAHFETRGVDMAGAAAPED